MHQVQNIKASLYPQSKKIYSSSERKKITQKEHKMTASSIIIVVNTNIKIGESSSLESFGWAPGLARQMAGFQRDERADTLTFTNKETLLDYRTANKCYDQYFKNKAAVEKKAVEDKKIAEHKSNLSDI